MKAPIPQKYPRIDEPHKFAGYLDNSKLAPHKKIVPADLLKKIIERSVEYASKKSSRAILEIPESASDEQVREIYLKEGRSLLAYFRKYYGDPASTAYECEGRHFSEIAKEQFHSRTLQKERMNSGWRYQRIAYQCASLTNQAVLAREIAGLEPELNELDFAVYLEQSTGWRYENIIQMVCDVLAACPKESNDEILPESVVKVFGEECRRHKLLDDQGKFHSVKELVRFFCSAKL
jgi:hypothetical protein